MRKYKNYTDADVVENAAKVFSLAQLLEKLNLKVAGGNYANMKRKLQKLKINTDHWTGTAWNTGQQLKDWSKYTSAVSCKKHLIKLKGHRCEICGLECWNKEPIPLEIHHINGKFDNSLSNLQLMCCNCHALTKNWRGRANVNLNRPSGIPTHTTGILNPMTLAVGLPAQKVRKIQKSRKKWHSCENCCEFCLKKRKFCSPKCYAEFQKTKSKYYCRKVERPNKEKLEIEVKMFSFRKLGRIYGVSDNAVRKWCRYYGISF